MEKYLSSSEEASETNSNGNRSSSPIFEGKKKTLEPGTSDSTQLFSSSEENGNDNNDSDHLVAISCWIYWAKWEKHICAGMNLCIVREQKQDWVK